MELNMHPVCDVFYIAAHKANVPEDWYYNGPREIESDFGVVRLGFNGQYIYRGERHYGRPSLRQALKVAHPYARDARISEFLRSLPDPKNFNKSTSLARFCGRAFKPDHSYFISFGLMLQNELETYINSKVEFLHQYMRDGKDTEGDFVFRLPGNPNIIYNWEQLTNTENDTTKTKGVKERLNNREKTIREEFPEAAIQSLVFNPLLVDTTLEDSRYGHVCGINHLMQLIGEPAISDATFYAMSQELYEIVKNKLAS